MQLSYKRKSIYLAMITLLIISILGCDKSLNKTDYKTLLKNDAKLGIRNTLQTDYNQISLFRGEIYKLSIVSTVTKKVHYVGSSMGIIAASTINPQYEFNRFKKVENVNNEIVNDTISRKMLEVVVRNRLVLNNIYKVILTPLNTQLEKGKDINQAQQLEINELIRLTNRLLEDYSIILESDDLTNSNLNVQLKSMQKSQNELLNLTIPMI